MSFLPRVPELIPGLAAGWLPVADSGIMVELGDHSGMYLVLSVLCPSLGRLVCVRVFP